MPPIGYIVLGVYECMLKIYLFLDHLGTPIQMLHWFSLPGVTHTFNLFTF